MNAYEVKQQLSEQLRHQEQFVSAGVIQRDGSEYVLVRLLDKNFKQVRSSIPSKIDDVSIRVEKSGPISALDW